jgi:predicted ester cyclase
MDDAATRDLIGRLLASDEVWDDTKDELRDYMAELERGELAASDRDYIEKLAARLDGSLPETGEAAPSRISPATLVERFYDEVWNKTDEAVAREILHPDFRFHASLGAERHGPDGFIDYLRQVHAALSGFTCEIEGLLVEDGEAVARMRFHGTHAGPLFGVAATGHRIEWVGAAFFATDGTQITALWVLGDIDAVKRQLGISPADAMFDDTANKQD